MFLLVKNLKTYVFTVTAGMTETLSQSQSKLEVRQLKNLRDGSCENESEKGMRERCLFKALI